MEGKYNLEYVGGRILLKLILTEIWWEGSGWFHVTQNENKWQIFDDNEPLTFVKCEEF
jgi:hypothetical protein